MLTCCERTKPLCGHLSCSMANGGTLATAERKSPPDNDRNRYSHNSSMLAKQVFTQVDTDPRVLTQPPLLVFTCPHSDQDAISSLQHPRMVQVVAGVFYPVWPRVAIPIPSCSLPRALHHLSGSASSIAVSISKCFQDNSSARLTGPSDLCPHLTSLTQWHWC